MKCQQSMSQFSQDLEAGLIACKLYGLYPIVKTITNITNHGKMSTNTLEIINLHEFRLFHVDFTLFSILTNQLLLGFANPTRFGHISLNMTS